MIDQLTSYNDPNRIPIDGRFKGLDVQVYPGDSIIGLVHHNLGTMYLYSTRTSVTLAGYSDPSLYPTDEVVEFVTHMYEVIDQCIWDNASDETLSSAISNADSRLYTYNLPEGTATTFNGKVVAVQTDTFSLEPGPEFVNRIAEYSYLNPITTRIRSKVTRLEPLKQVPSTIDYVDVEDILSRNPAYNWLLERDYQIVTPETVNDVCRELMQTETPIGFDTETTGLNINFRSQYGEGDYVVGLVFSPHEGKSYYIPLRHNAIENVCPPEDIPHFMSAYIKPILQSKTLVLFNAAFDAKTMLPYNILLNHVIDVQALYHTTLFHTERGVPDVEKPGKISTNLKSLANHYLHRRPLELTDFLPANLRGKKNAWSVANFADLPAESVRLYACADSDNTLGLYNLWMSWGVLEKYGAANTFNLENAFTNVVAYSEYFGIYFDQGQIEHFRKEMDDRYNAAYQAIVDATGKEFNPNSPKQKSALLYEDLGYPCHEYTDTGAPSTSKSALTTLANATDEDGNPLYPIAKYMLELAEVTTYQKTFLKSVDSESHNGYFFPSINAYLETGRMSTSHPNIQGVPSFVKKYYTSREGYYTMNFDFSSVEYRIMASLAKETDLIEFFDNPIKDYHRRQASVLFDIPYAQVTSKQRKIAKPFNFGLPYGKGDYSMGRDLFGVASEENTRKAAELRAKYFAGQRHIEQFFIDAKRDARENGYVETYFHRRRYFDPIRLGKGNLKKGIAAAERQAGNHRIQGTAADLYKMGMIRLYQAIIKRGWWGRVTLSAMVHDECNMEVHESIPPWEIYQAARESVMISLPGWCPLYVGLGYGNSWGQAKSQDLPVGVQDMILQVNQPNSTHTYDWDGDIQSWYDYCERLRVEYMVKTVIEYCTDPANHNQVMDPDIDDFAHLIMGDEATEGTHPNLRNALIKYNAPDEITSLPLESLFLTS